MADKEKNLELTHAKIVNFNEFKKIILSPELPLPYSADSYFLIIYAINSKFTRITSYPILKTHVVKLSLEFTECNSTVITQIGEILHSLSLIHTTGICEKYSKLVIEDYFSDALNTAQIQEIRNRLLQIPQITNIKTKILSKLE